MRLHRNHKDLSSQYREFKIMNRADQYKIYKFGNVVSSSPYFSTFILFSIIGNTIVLALDRYPEPDSDVALFDQINIGFTLIFLIEMVLKLLGVGFKEYFRDSWNSFDCVIVLTSIIDLLVSNILKSKNTDALTALRTFRLLRVFKLAKSWQRFQDLLLTMGRTLRDISVFSILLYLFIFTYTLLGLELFAYKIKFDEDNRLDLVNGETPETNFDNFLSATTSVFIVLTNDKWSQVYFDCYRAIGSVSAAFFITLVLIGQKILLNLFLAILLQNFDEDSLNREIQKKMKKKENILKRSKFEVLFERIQDQIMDFFNIEDNKDDTPLSKEGVEQRKANQTQNSLRSRTSRIIPVAPIKPPENLTKEQKEKSQALIDSFQFLEGTSLYIFSLKNKFRIFLHKVVTNQYFDYVIIFFIILSGVGLGIDNPLNDPNGIEAQIVQYIDIITTSVFIAEATMKITTFGFVLNGRSSYIRNIWNVIDFSIVIFSILSMTPLPNSLSYFKLLRVARPLRLISRNKGLKVAVRALVQAIPNIVNVMIITLLFFVIFGIIGISFFKGKFYYCLKDNVQQFNIEVISKWDCLNSGAEWMKEDVSFDNILTAAQTLFQMATTIGWYDVMFTACSATEIDYDLKPGNNPYWELFFIVFQIVGGIFLLNLFIGVVISNFNREKEKIGMNNLLTDRQKEWLDVRLLVINSKPIKKLKPPESKFRKSLFRLQEHKYFDYFILSCIIINTIVLMLRWLNQPMIVQNITDYINYIFTSIFALEATIKIIALGHIYFRDGWNVFDLVIVILSAGSVFVSANTSLNLGGATTIVRTFRVARIIRLVKRAKSLNLVFNTFILTLPALANVGSLLLLFLYLYAVIGVQIFSEIKRNSVLGDAINFETFPNAFLSLFIVATGDIWDLVMKAVTRSRDITFQCIYSPSYEDYINNGHQTVGCGVGVNGSLFFYSFYLLITLTFLNLFIAIILQGYEDTQTKENRLFNNDTLNHFRNVWADFDPEATTFIPIPQLRHFLFQLGYPLGFDKDYENSKFKQDKFIISLELPTYNDLKDYQFLDVLDALSLRVVVKDNYLKKKRELGVSDSANQSMHDNNSQPRENPEFKRQVSEWMENEIKEEINHEINKLKFQDQALNIHAVQKINKNEEKVMGKQQKLQKDEYFTSLHQAAAEAAFNHMRYIVKKRKAERAAAAEAKEKEMLSHQNTHAKFLETSEMLEKNRSPQKTPKSPKSPKSPRSPKSQRSKAKSPISPRNEVNLHKKELVSILKRSNDQSNFLSPNQKNLQQTRNANTQLQKDSINSFGSSYQVNSSDPDKIIEEELHQQSVLHPLNLQRLHSELRVIDEEQKRVEREEENMKIIDEEQKIQEAQTRSESIQVQVRDRPRSSVKRNLQDGSLGGTREYVLSSEQSEDGDRQFGQRTRQNASGLNSQKTLSGRMSPAKISREMTQIIQEEVIRKLSTGKTMKKIEKIMDDEERQLQRIIEEEIIDDSFISAINNKLEEELAEVDIENGALDLDRSYYGLEEQPAKRLELFLHKRSTVINA